MAVENTQEGEYVKIAFSFHSNILDKWMTETMWALPVDIKKGLYKLDNIPFYAPSMATDDIFFAVYDEAEERLAYRNIVTSSGNSTIHVVMMDEAVEVNAVRDIFNELGCSSEAMKRYFAMNVPAALDYRPVRHKLDELQAAGTLDYAESCLAEQHAD